MSDASVFLRKRKDKQRHRVPTPRNGPAPPPGLNRPAVTTTGNPSNGSISISSSTPGSSSSSSGNVIEFKLISTGNQNGIRHNVMRLNHVREIDPTQMTSPLLMNRKQPGPRAPPIFETNEEGRITGKYVYDKDGKPVIGEDGKPVVERRTEMDMSLVGTMPGQAERKKARKGVKEVYHQDIDIIKLRREEANPWILESGRPVDEPTVPEHWVGKMLEQPNMPSVLLVNDGTMGMEFGVVPLGRTYKFEPERPFKVLDPEAAHKLFEHQSKHRIHDRWGQREGGPLSNPTERARTGTSLQSKQEERAKRLEQQMRAANGGIVRPRVKLERFDDDYKREGRQTERGMEGGEDEELDFDENEHFQDDDDVNTFYRNEEEEEEAKLQEERLKREFKMANANVGDRPQIESDEDEEDLFGDKLNIEGKKLRRMMKKRGQDDDMYGTSDSDDESDSESVKSKDSKEKEKEAEKKEGRSTPGSAEKPASSQSSSSRGPASRRGTSPGSRRPPGPPTPSKAGTAPPGSGAAFLAQRAAADRGASPKRSRQNSPMSGRGQSPDNGRAASPAVSREGSPAPSLGGSQPKSKSGKRKTTSESPAPSSAIGSPNASGSAGPSNKRKTSPTGSVAGSDTTSRKKKKSSSGTPTPKPEIQPFPGMITRDEIAGWFRSKGKTVVPMSDMVQAFRKRVREAPDNQSVFLSLVNEMTTREPDKMLKIKDGIL